MKTQLKIFRILALAVYFSCSLFVPANAQDFFAGVYIGSSDFDGSQFGESEIGWGAHIGFDFGRYFGVELSYTDYQEFNSRVPGQLQPNPIAISLSGIIKYPLIERLEIYAKAGYANINSDVDSFNPFYIGSQDESNPLYGVGFSYLFSDDWEIRLGAERTELDLGTIPAGSFFTRSKGDLDILSVGLIRNF